MAVVVWVFAGGGEAELGIIPWLQRHFPDVRFERRTPQVRNPGPRPGGAVRPVVVGNTGAKLGSEIRSNLTTHWKVGSADVLLLLDDTDCSPPDRRDSALRAAIAESIPEPEIPPIAVALAVPELEVWLLADWANTFQRDRPACCHEMRRRLKADGVDFERPEAFDCRCTAEYRKISETIRNAYEVCCGPGPRYSKDTDTRRLLSEVDPETVARRCPHFKSFWNALVESCSAIGSK